MKSPSAADEGDLNVSVLIVGGGPAGLSAVLELARRGIRGLLVERRGFTTHYPRAHLLNVRTMETFHDVGAADEIYAESPPEDRWHKVVWYTSLGGPTPLHGLKIGEVPAWGGGPDANRYAEASPRRFANLPQLRVDQILWAHADRAWPGMVRPHQEVTALAHHDSGATATVHDRTSGRSYQVRARYVIAADGGRTCSDLLGVGVAGPRALLDMVNVYFSADLSAYADPEALLTYFINPAGQGSFSAALLGLGPGRWGNESPEWSLGMAYRIGDPAGDDREAMLRCAVETIGVPDLEMTVHAISHWQFEGVVAERFRVGPVFLVGDAAHRHPPTGGLGLNTAIGDVTNLGWKLAAVLQGQADDSLLDSYELERMPVAARNVEHSLRNAGRHGPVAAALGLRRGQTHEEGWAEVAIWAGQTPEGDRRREQAAQAVADNAEDYSQLNIEAGYSYESGAVIGDSTPPPPWQDSATEWHPSARPGHHVPHVWLERAGAPISTSDLVASVGMTLFVDAERTSGWQDAANRCTDRVTVVTVGGELADPAGEWAAVRGTDTSGAVLVRPDRHVAWRSAQAPADPAAALQSVLDRLLRRPMPSTGDVRSVLAGIVEAGEALRVTSARAPQLFSAAE